MLGNSVSLISNGSSPHEVVQIFDVGTIVFGGSHQGFCNTVFIYEKENYAQELGLGSI